MALTAADCAGMHGRSAAHDGLTLHSRAPSARLTAEMPPAGDTAGSLHVLDIERQSNELIVHSFHLFDENQMVIKTQAIIEVVKS